MTQLTEQIAVAAIARHKKIDASAIKPDSEFTALGITSLDAIAIAYELEEELGIEIPNASIENLATVQDLIDGIECLTGD